MLFFRFFLFHARLVLGSGQSWRCIGTLGVLAVVPAKSSPHNFVTRVGQGRTSKRDVIKETKERLLFEQCHFGSQSLTVYRIEIRLIKSSDPFCLKFKLIKIDPEIFVNFGKNTQHNKSELIMLEL